MTYCVAMKLNDGLVLCSDSRTNAGVDHIASFRKLYVFETSGERIIYLQSAGNLATTQSVINVLEHAVLHEERHLLNVTSMFEVAEIIGKTVRDIIARDQGQSQGVDFSCNILISGQIRGEGHRLFHIYPEGNFIEATEDTPYFQIGEAKYGKPIIDRIIDFYTPLPKAMQCALISMDSTINSNLSVGLPLDTIQYQVNSLQNPGLVRLDEHSQSLQQLRMAWSDGIKQLFDGLPEYF